jgi:type VI secretion system protein ImpK
MNLPSCHNSLLVAYFHEFYEEIMGLKNSLSSIREYSQVEPGSQAVAAPASRSQTVWQKLLTVLEQQALEAGRSGGAFAFGVYREAQYVMASLADEIFLHLDWEGKKDWPLLEAQLFHSHAAGQVFFEKLDRLLQRKDPFYVDLAAVYLMALMLGFEGKFRDTDDGGQLEKYRRQLFLMIFKRQPALFDEDVHLFPESYLHTLREGKGRRLPNPRRWLWVMASVIVAWLILSQALWVRWAGDVNQLVCRINPAACGDVEAGQ